MFLGDLVTNPIHVAIIADGNGIDIHHTVFRENKITVVYWKGGSRGHAMRHCIITGCYGSGLWTAGIAADFRFEHSVSARQPAGFPPVVETYWRRRSSCYSPSPANRRGVA